MRLLILLLALFPLLATAQTTRTFKITIPGYGQVNVAWHAPAGHSASKKMPGVIFIPGNGEVGSDPSKLYDLKDKSGKLIPSNGPLAWYKWFNASKYPDNFVLIGLQPIYEWAGAPLLYHALVELSKPEYGLSSISATGLSGGANTIIEYIQKDNRIKLRAAAPMSIRVSDTNNIKNFATTPLWVFSGSNDGPHTSTLKPFTQKMIRAGYPAKYTEYPGGHCCWNDVAYNPAKGMYEFLTGASGVPTTPPPVVAPSKRILFDLKGSGRTVYNTTLKPGDTAVLTSSGTYFTLVGVKGVTVIADKAITLLNGFSVENGEDIEINGQYLVTIRGVGKDTAGPAISVTGTAKNITVREIIAKRKFTGVWWKNEASCDVSKNFPANVMDGCYIYDNRIDSMTNQGMYIGSTDANNHSRPITCNGTVYNYLPSRIRNIEVVGNFVSNTGRPGIQVSGAYEGKNIISENTVYNTGIGGDDAQGTGISIGAYTRAIIEKNDVRKSGTWLIASLGGAGEVIIRDNYLDSAGWNSKGGVTWASAIGINTVRTVPVDSTYMTITGNQIGSYRHPQAITIGNDAKTLARQVTISGNLHKGQPASVLDNSGFVTPPPVTPPPAKTILRVITVYTDGTVEYK